MSRPSSSTNGTKAANIWVAVGKLWALLSARQRKSFVILVILMIVGMVLETLGLGLVVPTIALLTNEHIADRSPTIAAILARLGNPTREHLIVGGMSTLAALFFFKAGFMAFLNWRQMKFSFGLQAALSQRLFSTYMSQPYSFHLRRNSAYLIQNITTETSDLTFNVVLPSMVLITEGLILIGFAALLLSVEPIGAIIVATILAATSWAFYGLTRRKVERWGMRRQYHEGLRIKHLQQGLGGVKDVKLLGREPEFVKQYSAHNAESARITQLQITLQQLPRLWLEVLAIAGLAALVFVMLTLGRPIDILMPTLGLFAAAAFRLMPSVNRILNSLQSLRFGLPGIDTVHRELLTLDVADKVATHSASLTFEREIEMVDMSYTYAGASAPALKNVSLKISRLDCVGFIGPSGAGKSTVVDLLLGLLTPTRGQIRVDGHALSAVLRGWQDIVGYVPQTIFLTDDTLARNIAFGLPDAEIDVEAVWTALRAARLEEFVTALPDGVNAVVGERGVRLSGGQRQRIGIARALYRDPPILVLDEATSSLDGETERAVMDAVSALKSRKTLVIIAHRLTTVARCNRIFRVTDGSVVEMQTSSAPLNEASR